MKKQTACNGAGKQSKERPNKKQKAVLPSSTTTTAAGGGTKDGVDPCYRYWDVLHVDMAMVIFSYLNVRETGRFSQTSKQGCYLVHCYHCLQGPQITMVSSDEEIPDNSKARKSPIDMQTTLNAVKRIQSPPHLALVFQSYLKTNYKRLERPSYLPRNCVVLRIESDSVQALGAGMKHADSTATVLLASLPHCTVQPFLLKQDEMEGYKSQSELEDLIVRQLGHGITIDDMSVARPVDTGLINDDYTTKNIDWKLIIIYPCSENRNFAIRQSMHKVIAFMEQKYPNATIVATAAMYHPSFLMICRKE
jgi:hypothetical protein